jgi:hypothetical protein
MPAATLVRRRSFPLEPNDTVLATLLVEPEPTATEFAAVAELFGPIAVDLVAQLVDAELVDEDLDARPGPVDA